MKEFTKKKIDHTPIADAVFLVADMAAKASEKYGKENVVNATIGSLYNEENTLVALDTVFSTYNQITSVQKAKYAQSFVGNDNFRQRVYEWVLGGIDTDLAHSVIASPGGSGAVSMTISNILDEGETLIVPDIAWGSYRLMATMNNLAVKDYLMFDGDKFNMDSFKSVCNEVMDAQGKVLVIVNDPCHNPTGYTMTNAEWDEMISVANEISKKGPFVILNDIAYIDYSYNLEKCRDYMKSFNNMGENVMINIAFSSSKTLTSYGLRCGACVCLAKEKETVEEFTILAEKSARASWSNIPNAAMENFVLVTTEKYDEFMAEKQGYVDLLKERSYTFKNEAEECGLECYPYKEGFFVTVKVEDNALKNKYHAALMEENIFTVQVGKGIRVAVCSLPVRQCKGLAKKMKDILEKVKMA